MLSLRLADMSGPFFDPSKPFRNWSAFPFTQLDQPQAPYVDQAHLDWGVARAIMHLHVLHSQGYNGIVVDNLAHLVTLDATGAIPPDSPTRRRALIYQVAFGRLFAAADALGMAVFVTTDMQWSTPDLRRVVGDLSADNPRLAQVNRLALAELFAVFPHLRGVIVRVGETGGAHNQGDAYTGHMLYTSPEALRSLITDLLPVVEQHDRLLVMRTWSVGIGALGDLICSPERYHATFGDLRSAHLLVSIKHGPADFFRLMPPNPTLGLPGPRQIVELQTRREYELFGLVPSSIAALHQAALQRAYANPQVVGVWAWNSTGGWGGGKATLGTTGWNLWTELGSALTGALAQQPGRDAEAFVRAWLAQRWPDTPFARAVADLYLASAALIEQGWYTGHLPNASVRLGGIHLSPLLWVWWMRPTAALPIWAYLSAAIGDPQQVLAASAAAYQQAVISADRLAALAPADDADAVFVAQSARYFADALLLAHHTRSLMLPLLGAAQAGKTAAVLREPACRAALEALRQTIGAHQVRWGNRSDFPALELAELTHLSTALSERPQRTWVAVRTAVSLVRGLRERRAPGGRLGVAGAVGVAGLGLALLSRRPHRLGVAGLLVGLLLTPAIRRRTLHYTLPWLSRRFHLLPSVFFEAGPAISEWAA
jgi:hypothetical protein